MLLKLSLGFGFDLDLKCLASVCKDSKFALMINRKLLALTYSFCVCWQDKKKHSLTVVLAELNLAAEWKCFIFA